MIICILILLLSNFIGAISQVLLKKSALENHKSFLYEYLNIKVIFAYALFFIAVFFDLLALKRVPVSFIPVVETSSYFFAIVLSRIFFKERICIKQIIALVLVISGIIIYVF